MKRYLSIIFTIFLCLMIYSNVYARISGVKPPRFTQLAPVKIDSTAGYIKIFSAANSFGVGFIGPDTATKNIYLKAEDESPAEGDTIILGVPYDGTVNSEAATIIPYTYGVIAGGGGSTVNVNGVEVSAPNFATSSEIVVTNTTGTVTYTLANNSITLAKISSNSILTKAEIEADGYVDLNDNTILTSAGTYSLVAEILGLPDVTIVTPAPGDTVTSSTYDGFSGTAEDSGTVSLIEWKLSEGGTYSTTGVTGTVNWSVSGIALGSDGEKYLFVRVTDDEGNTKEQSVSFNLNTVQPDTTDPIIVAGADGTHNGVASFTAGCVLTEDNPSNPAVTFTVTGATPTSGNCTGSYPNFITPDLTPDGTGTVTVTFSAIDLAGNTATGTDLIQEFVYSGTTYTTTLTDDFNRADNVNVITGSPWTSETDAAALGSILSNEYSIILNGAGLTYISKTFTENNTDYELTFKFKVADVVGVDSQGLTKSITIVQLRCTAGIFYSINLRTDISGNIATVSTSYYNDAGTSTSASIPYTINADTYITGKIRVDIGEPGVSDGILYSELNSIEITNLTGLSDETRPILSELRVGLVYREWTESNTLTFDDVSLGYK